MENRMNAERDLLEACREWRRLAEAEGEAIRTGNWGLCSACQNALQLLRDRMSALMPVVRDEWAQPGCDRDARDHDARQQSLDDTLRELIGLERRNQTLLNAVREAAHVKIKQLNQAKIKLRQLRSSYGFAHGSAWSSFS
jgi:hypothetical protein